MHCYKVLKEHEKWSAVVQAHREQNSRSRRSVATINVPDDDDATISGDEEGPNEGETSQSRPKGKKHAKESENKRRKLEK